MINYLPGDIMKNFVTISNFFLKLKLFISLTSIPSSFCSFLIYIEYAGNINKQIRVRYMITRTKPKHARQLIERKIRKFRQMNFIRQQISFIYQNLNHPLGKSNKSNICKTAPPHLYIEILDPYGLRHRTWKMKQRNTL